MRTHLLPERAHAQDILTQLGCRWFLDCAWEGIRRDNCLEFLAYGMYASKLEDLSPEARPCCQPHCPSWQQPTSMQPRKLRTGQSWTLIKGLLTANLCCVQARQDVGIFLDWLELRHDVRIPRGRNPDLRFMASIWEPLRVLPKPLLMYLVAETMGLCTDAVLWGMGFKAMRCQVSPVAVAQLQSPSHGAGHGAAAVGLRSVCAG